MARQKRRTRTAPATVGALIAAYRRAHDPDAIWWLNGYDAAHLAVGLGRIRLADLSEQRITEYSLRREARGAHAKLINEELEALTRILEWGQEKRYIAQVPTIWLVRTPTPQTPRFSPRLSPPSVWGRNGDTLRERPGATVPPTTTHRTPKKKAGRLAPIADAAFRQHVMDHPELSDGERGAMLHLTRDQVRRLRKKLAIPPSRPPSGAQ